MKTIVVGDLHGCYVELLEMMKWLNESGTYNPDVDKLVFLGDYIDRGENPAGVVKYIRGLQDRNENVIALMGNHEDMMIDYYDGVDDISWLYNGCRYTLASYDGDDSTMYDDIEWMRNLPLYYEDDYFVYVHAGINPRIKKMCDQNKDTLLWVREKFINSTTEYDKRVIFGHTPTLSLTKNNEPVETFCGNIDIDTGCVYDGALTALIIDNDEILGYHQVEPITRED